MEDDRREDLEISYACSAATRGGRVVIRALENVAGRIRLIRRAQCCEREIADGRDFWQVIVDRYGLSLEVARGSLDGIPKSGPLIAIANHPYGILDGLMLGCILSMTLGDFRIVAHRVFRKAEDLDRAILPVSFDETPEAVRRNVATRKTALDYLAKGGAIGIFPGGTVSTAPKPFTRPLDPVWRGFTAKMIAESDAAVVPLHFFGRNSRLFQIAGHLHYTLRVALLLNEFRVRADEPAEVVVGEPIPRNAIDAFGGDSRSLKDFLRRKTCALGPRPLDADTCGFECDDRYRS